MWPSLYPPPPTPSGAPWGEAVRADAGLVSLRAFLTPSSPLCPVVGRVSPSGDRLVSWAPIRACGGAGTIPTMGGTLSVSGRVGRAGGMRPAGRRVAAGSECTLQAAAFSSGFSGSL